jgi:hypothetical protein
MIVSTLTAHLSFLVDLSQQRRFKYIELYINYQIVISEI